MRLTVHTSCSRTHLLRGRSSFRHGIYSCVVSLVPTAHAYLVVALKALPMSIPLAATFFPNLLNQILGAACYSSSLFQTVLRVAIFILAKHEVLCIILAKLTEEESNRLQRSRGCTNFINFGDVLRPWHRLDIRECRVFRFTVRRHSV